MSEPSAASKPRRSQLLVWAGLLTTLAGGISYMLLLGIPFVRNSAFPNVLIVLLGVAVAGLGAFRVFQKSGPKIGKAAAVVGLLLTIAIAGLFNFFLYVYSADLPESAGAPGIGASAHDFELTDHTGRAVRLSDYRGRKVVLLFYRGFW